MAQQYQISLDIYLRSLMNHYVWQRKNTSEQFHHMLHVSVTYHQELLAQIPKTEEEQ
jgi:hypothetical protein